MLLHRDTAGNQAVMVKVVGLDGWKGISIEHYKRLVRIHFLGEYSFHLYLHDSFLPQQVKFIDQTALFNHLTVLLGVLEY